MKHIATIGALALVVAACGGDTAATSTTSGPFSTTSIPGSSTTTSIAGSTTVSPTITGGANTTEGPPPTVAPEITQVAFAFATGDDPRVLVRVSVGETPDGPWLPAGISDDTPTLTGLSYWVRFDITNTDDLGAVLTDLDISGFEAGSPLGADVCQLDAPLPPGEQTDCVIGSFPVVPGPNDVDFFVSGVGPRQGEPERWFAPPIPTSLEFGGARNSFFLVFDTSEGFAVEGIADGSEIAIDGISGSVRLDCSGGSPFDGEPGLKAYVIESFSADGERVGGCSEIPSQELEFSPDDDEPGSDDVYLYFGAETTTFEAGTTSTIPVTTTSSG